MGVKEGWNLLVKTTSGLIVAPAPLSLICAATSILASPLMTENCPNPLGAKPIGMMEGASVDKSGDSDKLFAIFEPVVGLDPEVVAVDSRGIPEYAETEVSEDSEALPVMVEPSIVAVVDISPAGMQEVREL